jgi:hypothetical protein
VVALCAPNDVVSGGSDNRGLKGRCRTSRIAAPPSLSNEARGEMDGRNHEFALPQVGFPCPR